jgi:hypothetical protein
MFLAAGVAALTGGLGCSASTDAEGGGGAGGGDDGTGGDGTGGSAAGGRGGAGGAGRLDARPNGPVPDGGSPGPRGPAKVVISEIMYHPFDENAADEAHEFVEIANPGTEAITIGGWKLEGQIAYTFPAGQRLAPGQHLAIAKDPSKVAAVYKVAAADVVGPFTKELDNGGGRLALVDAAGAKIDEVRYDDEAPWPMGADSFGVGKSWLVGLDPAAHRYKGYSLERISAEIDGNDPVNWTTSALSAATPGQANRAAGKLEAIVLQATHAAKDDAKRTELTDKDTVLVRVTFSKLGKITSPAVEYFVDDVEKADDTEAKKIVDLKAVGDAWEAEMPLLPANTVVRYRVLGDRGAGERVKIGPRESDPYKWYAYFVGPSTITGKTPAYQLFISKANWLKLYKNVEAGRVPKKADGSFQCDPNPTWNDKVPAVLVRDGRVIDVQARYQGSPFNRTWGPFMKTYPADKRPSAPAPGTHTTWDNKVYPYEFRALSWHFSLPRYAPINGSRDVILNKRANECNFVNAHVAGRIFESANIPAPQVRLARLFVNGVYYHYMTDMEHPDEQMLERAFKSFGQTDIKIGDYFKSVGWYGVQGPYTWGDERVLAPIAACPKWTVDQLYAYTYDRGAPEYKSGSAEVREMVEALNKARDMDAAAGPNVHTAKRAFFEKTFDVPLTTKYIALVNWMVPWDDFFQNHFLYRKPDGKWTLMPWDFDNMFGSWRSKEDERAGLTSAQSSFFIGEFDNRSNRGTDEDPDKKQWKSYLKDAYIKAYREEIKAELGKALTKELAPAMVDKYLADILAAYVRSEADAAPTNYPGANGTCDANGAATRIKTFTRDRNARVTAGAF